MGLIDGKKIWDLSRIPDREKTRLELTDLCFYKGYFYCGFCEGEIHMPHPSGRARIIRSRDTENWETAALFDWDAGDVRDPIISVTPENILMVNSSIRFVSKKPKKTGINEIAYLPPDAVKQKNYNNSFYQLESPETPETDSEEKGVVRQSVTWLSDDGINWSSCFACESGVNNWRWYTTWHNGMGYNIAYTGKDKNGTLYRTRDGKLRTKKIEGNANIGGAGTSLPMLGIGKAPYYTEWEWKEIKFDWDGSGKLLSAEEALRAPLGGPKLLALSNGQLIAAGRTLGPDQDDGRIVLFTADPEKLVFKKIAEINGTTYAGIVEHEGKIWVSCANKDVNEILLAKVDIPD